MIRIRTARGRHVVELVVTPAIAADIADGLDALPRDWGRQTIAAEIRSALMDDETPAELPPVLNGWEEGSP